MARRRSLALWPALRSEARIAIINDAHLLDAVTEGRAYGQGRHGNGFSSVAAARKQPISASHAETREDATFGKTLPGVQGPHHDRQNRERRPAALQGEQTRLRCLPVQDAVQKEPVALA